MIWFAEHDRASRAVTVGYVEGGERSVVAQLDAPAAVLGAPLVVVTPSRQCAAVLVEERLWIVRADGGPPSEQPRVDRGASEDEPVLAVLVWGPDGPMAVRSFAGRRVLPLADGWTLEVSGDVRVDGGFSGGHHESSGRFEPRPSAQVRLTHEATIVDVPLEPGAGTSTLMWPPVVGPDGVLLRWSVTSAGGGHTHTKAQAPVLVSAGGAASVIPVELGVSPLLALADGGFLLPGVSPLWRDDYDEPLHRLDVSGSLRPYLHAGREISPSGLVAAHAPAWAATREQFEAKGDAVWTFEQARYDASSGALRLLLTDQELFGELDPAVRWLAFEVPRDDTQDVRLIARGTHDAAFHLAVAV